MTQIARAVLDQLRTFSTPSLANGIETFDVRPRNEGYMDATVRCLFPELGPLLGYAATATIRAAEPGESRTREVWAHLMSLPEPRVVVIQDLERPRRRRVVLGRGEREHPPSVRRDRRHHERLRA